MNQLERTLTSLEIAEMVERRHDQVMRDIRTVIEHLGGQHKSVESYFIESTYTNTQNKTQPCFLLTKKGCELYGTMTGEKVNFTFWELAAFRRYRNITQKEMAEIIGVSERAYIDKEHGRTQFKSSEMFLIARKLNKSIEEIFSPPGIMIREVCENKQST